MKKYIAILTNTFLDINNVRMTNEAIKNILRRQPEVPVTINFGGRAIGRVIGFSEDNSMLSCELEIDESKLDNFEPVYAVPGLDNVEYHNEGRTRVIDRGDLTEVSLTNLPANQHVRPIQLKGEKDES